MAAPLENTAAANDIDATALMNSLDMWLPVNCLV